MFKRFKSRFGARLPRTEASRDQTVNLLERVFQSNDIKAATIDSVYTFEAGDYSDAFFKRTEQALEAGDPIVRGQEKLSWNKPHLHFHLVVVDGYRLFAIAIIYPYEITHSEQVLMIKEFKRAIDDPYIQQLMICRAK